FDAKWSPYPFIDAGLCIYARIDEAGSRILAYSGPQVCGFDQNLSQAGYRRPTSRWPGSSSGGEAMKVWPDADGTLVRRYLRTLGLRNSDSQRCVLNDFQRFVAGRVDDKTLRVSTVEFWVRERASEWSL